MKEIKESNIQGGARKRRKDGRRLSPLASRLKKNGGKCPPAFKLIIRLIIHII